MATDRVRSGRPVGASASASRRPPIGRGGRRAGTSPGTAARRRETLTLVAMCLGVLMTFLLVTATISALSAIRDDLHVSPSALIWIPSAYTLVVASLVMSAGTLGNLWGRKRMFCVGVVVMIGGGLLAASAGTTAMVIAAQLVSGVGGALILPNSLAILGATFTDPHRRTEVITVWAASSGIGLAVGPLLAGVLLGHFGWQEVFVPNAVLGVITLLVAVPFATESLAPGGRLDIPGALLGTVTIASLVYALIQGGQDGYTAAPVITACIVAAAGAVAFVAVELRVAAPMLSRVWPLFVLFGAACGLVVAPSTAAALVSVAPERTGMASGAVNTARQVGAVMGTALLGSLFTSRVAADLPHQLAAHGVPAAARAPVEAAVASGSTGTQPLPSGGREAIEGAFTSGIHAGLAVTAAVPALAAVHNRPHRNGTHMPAPTTS
ncbi:MFS transporter [Streptomyces sp. FXJ1.4098]|uniref:MFS transporter n=1 Tax=Streptomyces sp. NPDC020845 TaxID=3365096 RepID=UPI002994C3F2|nr:MFS transporter [Streptomyces sp. FXJ1.4098]